MEIFEFLELSARRIVLLALLAVLVAVPTAAYFAIRAPRQYRVTATVRLAPFIPPGTNASETAEIDDGFQATLGVPDVVNAIAKTTHVSPTFLRDHLRVVFPGAAPTAELTYTSKGRDASAVARTAAVAALTFLARQEVDDARASVAQAQQRASDAIAAFESYETRSGAGDAASRLADLSREEQALEGRIDGGSDVTSELLATRAEAVQVEAALPQYAALRSAVDQALGNVQGASAALGTAQNAMVTATSGSTVAVKGLAEVSHLKGDLIDGFAAGLVAVLLAVAALAVDELQRRPAHADRLLPAGGPSTSGPLPARQSSPDDAVPTALPADRGGAALARSRISRVLSPSHIMVGGTVLLLPVSLLATVGVLLLIGQHRTTLALMLAAPIGLLAGILAFTRFEVFLAAMVVVRASLDSFNISSGGTVGLDPGVVLGAVFIVAAVLWLAAQRRSGRWVRTSRVTWALWAFAAACVISIPASVLPAYSAVGASKVIAGVLMFSVLEQYLGRRPERAKVVVWCLFLSLLVPGIVGLRQWVTNKGNLNTAGVSRVSGTFVHPASFALYLLMVLPLALVLIAYYRGALRVVLVGVAGACALLIVVTYTRDAWIAAIVAIAYLGFRFRRGLLYAMVATIVVLAVAVPSITGRLADLHSKALAPGAPPQPNSLTWRIDYWHRLLPLADSNPVTGIGFETVERTTTERLAPHNGFVEAYVETGVLGLAALVWTCWELFAYFRRRSRSALPGWDRLLALGGVAVALALLMQIPGENLLTQTYVFWYTAVAITFGLRSPRQGPEPAAVDRGSAHTPPALLPVG